MPYTPEEKRLAMLAAARRHYAKNREKILAKAKAKRKTPHGGVLRQRMRDWRKRQKETNLDHYLEVTRAAGRRNYKRRRARNAEQIRQNHLKWRRANRDKVSAIGKRWSLKVRRVVIDAYGGCCSCCGESQYEFLSLDHVNGDGSKHRRMVGSNRRVYLDAIRRNFPPDYQILCHNCNMAKGMYGQCPHERERTKLLPLTQP